MVRALSTSIGFFFIASKGLCKVLLKATARKMEMITADMPTMNVLLARMRIHQVEKIKKIKSRS